MSASTAADAKRLTSTTGKACLDAAERSAALVPRRWPDASSPLVHKSCTSGSVDAVNEGGAGAADAENLQVSAEARGFEPRMGLKSQTALAVRRHRPG